MNIVKSAEGFTKTNTFAWAAAILTGVAWIITGTNMGELYPDYKEAIGHATLGGMLANILAYGAVGGAKFESPFPGRKTKHA